MTTTEPLRIISFPDPRLKRKAVEINPQMIQSEYLQNQFLEMEQLASKTPYAVGLAASQVGLPYAAFVFVRRVDDEVVETITVINPKIVNYIGQPKTVPEACLSLAGVAGKVSRFPDVEATWLDREGKSHLEKFDGIWSQAWQHEADHLRGKCFYDVMTQTARNRLISKYLEKQV